MTDLLNKVLIGYIEESSYAIRDKTATSNRRFGFEGGESPILSEERDIIRQKISSNFDAASVAYGDASVKFDINYVLLDPREISYLTNSDNITYPVAKRFKMVFMQPSDAFVAPSRTIHMETVGLTTEHRIDAAGCLDEAIDLTLAVGDPAGMRVKESFLGQRVTDSFGLTSNLYNSATEDPEGSVLATATNDLGTNGSAPRTMGTAGNKFRTGVGYDTSPVPYTLVATDGVELGGTGNVTTGLTNGSGLDLTPFVQSLGIKIIYEYEVVRPNRAGFNNYAQSIQPYIMAARIKNRTFAVSLVLDPKGDVVDLKEKLSLETLNDEIYIRVEKAGATTPDWISFIFKGTGTLYNPFVSYEGKAGFEAVTQFHTLLWAPNELTIMGQSLNETVRADDAA